MKQPSFPSLYQINTRVWLTELSGNLGRRATLDDIPDHALDQIAAQGFDWIWFLSVWRTGDAAQKISREHVDLRYEFEETLPDLRQEDIAGSGFAINGYKVHSDLGGDESLSRLRSRLMKRGIKLMLDFVPNHVAPDHPWVEEHPDYFISGTETDLEVSPQNFTRVKRNGGDLILAYGRDPNFPGWSDTLQLDYSNPALQAAMVKEILRISDKCDGVRCDMAMLMLPEVFKSTWGRTAQPFWPKATRIVREKHPEFFFMAEVYWDLEWNLQQQGFDFTYDKRLYDRLRQCAATTIREHFYAPLDYQSKLVRFLENHDEQRAAATFEKGKHEAAAVITFLSPGLRFFHHGQLEGKRKRISTHLVRAPKEPIDEDLKKFYTDLLSTLKNPLFRNGSWQLLQCLPAWEGNGSSGSFVAFGWEAKNSIALIAVNYSPHPGQCYICLPYAELNHGVVRFTDLMSTAVYDRLGADVVWKGIYLDLPPWGYHIFEVNSPARLPGQLNSAEQQKNLLKKNAHEILNTPI